MGNVGECFNDFPFFFFKWAAPETEMKAALIVVANVDVAAVFFWGGGDLKLVYQSINEKEQRERERQSWEKHLHLSAVFSYFSYKRGRCQQQQLLLPLLLLI